MTNTRTQGKGAANRELILTRASEINPEPINWIWNGWLAKGKLTVFAGSGGAGKTTILLNLASAISTASAFPDNSLAIQGNVLIWSGEDDPEDVLVPRLIAAQASLERISFVSGIRDSNKTRSFNPHTDIAELKTAMREVGDISLLIIDPIVSFVNGNMHQANVVRDSLQPLLDLAQENGCAVIGITHLGKGSQGKDISERVIGSQAFSAVARMVWIAAVNKTSGEGVLVRSKSNLGSTEGGFSYQIKEKEIGVNNIYSTYISWMGYKSGTSQQIIDDADPTPDPQSDSGQLQDCMNWMREVLEDLGGSIAKTEVIHLGASNGYSASTIQRARKRLNLTTTQKGFGKEKASLWSLPSTIHTNVNEQSSQATSLKQLNHLDTNGAINPLGSQYEIN